jgi:tetratricopeptide (TPR) repeat protein
MKRPAAAFLSLLAALAALFGFFLLREFFFVGHPEILPNLRMPWHFARAFASSMEWVPLMQAAVILVAFGLFKDDERVAGASASLLKNSRGMLIFIVIAAAAYSLLVVFSLPDARKREEKIGRASDAFRTAIQTAEKAIKDSRWEPAREALEECAIIDRNDARYIEQKGIFDEKSVPATTEKNKPDSAASGASAVKTDLSANEYYKKAIETRAKGDLYTAHSLATKAARIDPKREELRRLASEIWEQISKMQEDLTENKQRARAIEKNQAYASFQAEDWLEAYARFLKLKESAPKDMPNDSDIDEYLQKSLDGVKQISFFKEELTRLSRFPSARRVFFRVKGEQGEQFFLSCQNLYFGVERAYLSGVECLSVTASGKPSLKFSVPYAKFQVSEQTIDSEKTVSVKRLLLVCIDKNDPGKAFRPAYTIQGKNAKFSNFLDVPFGLAELKLAALAASLPGEASIADLDAMRRGAKKIGVDPAPFINEGLMRIQACIAFLLVSLICLYLGHRFRYKGLKRPILSAIISFPISVFVAGIFLESWAWFNRTVMTILVRDLPLISIPAFVIVQAVALLLAFIVLAGYRDAPSD